MNLIDDMTEREAKELLNEISNIFSIGGKARTASVILTNVKNSHDDVFCRYKRAIEFLDGKSFEFISHATGYMLKLDCMVGCFHGSSIINAVQMAIDYEEENI